MKTPFRNKALALVDGENPATRPAATAPAQPTPIQIDPQELPAVMAAKIQQSADEITAGLRKEQDRLRAQIELAQDDARRIALRMRATGQSLAATDQADLDRYIAERQDRIDAIDTTIASLELRTRDRVERGAPLFAEMLANASHIIRTLASLQPAYDALAKQEDEFRSLMTDYRPNGMVSLVWLPRDANGTSVISVFKLLEPFFGKNGQLTRVQREARDAGLDGEPRS